MKKSMKLPVAIVVLIIALSSLLCVSAWQANTKNYPATTVNIDGSNVTGVCTKVIDGATIDVQGVGRIRFVCVNTPERGEDGYKEAKEFVKSKCLNKEVTVDVDDQKHYDKYDRILGVVYVDGQNLNQELLKQGYAEIMYMPPSEFNPYGWT